MGPDPGPQWRVFISHTSELRKYPQGASYIHAVEEAIIAAGHVPVDMSYFPAGDEAPANVCIQRVQSCDVYLGVLSTRYGSPVRDRPEVSYTELEYDTAGEDEIPRFMFVVDTTSPTVGIPPDALIDLERGARQEVFRTRLTGTVPRFKNPADLKFLVFQALKEEETRQRIAAGLKEVQRPAAAPPAQSSKIINQPPATAPTWFQDRVVETGLIANWLADPGIRMITVIGRGGMGKTAMVCQLLKALEAGQLPDLTQEPATMDVGGIVYLSPTGDHDVNYLHLINDLCRLLPPDTARIIQAHYQDPHNSPTHMMRAVLSALPRDEGPVIVLLDNLESVMDTAQESLTEGSLEEALQTVLRAARHPLKILVTTRVAPTGLLEVQPEAQQQIWLEEGLGPEDARTVLRALDPGGALNLENADDEVLNQLHDHTRGFPRALEAIKGILAANRPKLTPQNLVERIRDLPKNKVVEALVGQAYQALDAKDQQIMQALAVYPSPVAAVGVDFLLQPHNPTVNTTPVLDRLVRWHLVRYDPGHDHYYLHPVDRDYARAQIPRDASNGTDPAYTLAALQGRAADYYAQIRKPRPMWHSIDDVFAQLAEFELRCDTDDYETAATVLTDIDNDLQTWGHYRTLLELHTRLHGHLKDPIQQMTHLSYEANCHITLGNYQQAIELHTQALTIARKVGNRWGEAVALGNIGGCHYDLSKYPKAIELHSKALTINREIGHRRGEAVNLGNLGSCYAAQSNYPRAMDLYAHALALHRELGNRAGEAINLGNLGNCNNALGNYPNAIELYTQTLTIQRAIGNRAGESAVLGSLGGCHFALGNYPRAIELLTQALTIDREIGNRAGEATHLGGLGYCHNALGNYPQSIDLHTQALTIYREIGKRRGESTDLGGLGNCFSALGDYPKAIDLHDQALAIGREIGNRADEARHLSNRANCRSSMGSYAQAMADYEYALVIARDIGVPNVEATIHNHVAETQVRMGDQKSATTSFEEAFKIADAIKHHQIAVDARLGLAQIELTSGHATMALRLIVQKGEFHYPLQQLRLCLLEGTAQLVLGQSTQAQKSFAGAMHEADSLLDIAPQNVNALLVRALACCGLALTGAPHSRDEAVQDLGHLRAATHDVAGVLADVEALLMVLTTHDPDGILEPVRMALSEEAQP